MSEDTSPPPLPPRMPSYAQPPESGDDAGMRLLLPIGRSGWAIAAGYLGLLSVVLFPAPFAVIVSIIAMRHISRSQDTPKRLHGMGRAIFGLVMGGLGTLALIAVLIAPLLKR